jgi:hypothetical protein
VRVLLDENLPLEFAADIVGHSVATVRGLGWSGTKNGELMRRAASVCDILVTMDRNLPHQQNIPALSFGVIVVYARSNRLVDLRPITSELLSVIATTAPGSWVRVGV